MTPRPNLSQARALSLHQPWASLVVAGVKRVETRSWSTQFRGPLIVHASKAYSTRLERAANRIERVLEMTGRLDEVGPDGLDLEKMPRGAFLGVVRLVTVAPTPNYSPSALERNLGDFSPGRFAWVFEDARALDEPVDGRGLPGLWSPSPLEVTDIEAGLR